MKLRSSRVSDERLTVSSSELSAMITHQCSSPRLRSHGIHALCSMRGGRRNHPGLAAVRSVLFPQAQQKHIHESFSQMSAITSGAPFTYISMLVLRRRLTMTLIRRSCETNSNVRITPNSKKCACYSTRQMTPLALFREKRYSGGT
jgi:hypothetical protein